MGTTTADGNMNSAERPATLERDTLLKTDKSSNRQTAIRGAEVRSVTEGVQPSSKSSRFRASWILVMY
jgi:hypothetical protein